MNFFTVILSVALLSVYHVSARTCTCAQFVDTKCDEQENCVWNTRQSVGDVVKGNHGICRSNQWMDCHADESCMISGRHVVAEDGSRRRLSADESLTEMDWPYNCVTNEMQENLINVKAYQMLALKETLSDEFGKQNAKNFNLFTFSSVVKICSLIVFCLLLGGAMCYKFKGNKKMIDLNQSLNAESTTYATF